MRHATRWAIVLTIALGVVIAVLTLTPPIEAEGPAGSDKLYHFTAFLALALPLALVRPRWSMMLFIIFSAYGAAIEILQPHVGRSREFADLIADMAGIVCGIGAALLLRRVHRQLRGTTRYADENSSAEPSSRPRQH